MNHKELAGAQKLIADHKRANSVVTCASARVTNHVCVTLGEAGVFRWIQARVHASEDREGSCRRQSQLAFIGEIRSVLSIRFQDFGQNLAHGLSPVFYK